MSRSRRRMRRSIHIDAMRWWAICWPLATWIAGCESSSSDWCGWEEPEGCLVEANTTLLRQWTGVGLIGETRLASQGDHLILVEDVAVHRIAKDGSEDLVIATAPDASHRFVDLAEDGGYVYVVDTNTFAPAPEPGTLARTEILRIAPDGLTIENLADTVAPFGGFAVSGDEAFVSFCIDGGCFLDRVDLTAGSKTETSLSVRPRGRMVVGTDFIDYLGKTGDALEVVRLDRATAGLVDTYLYATSSGSGQTVAGPWLVGEAIYFGSGIDGNDGRVFSYLPEAPDAVAPVLPIDGAAQSWRAEVRAIVGDADGVLFHGFFERVEGSEQIEGWFGTAAYDPARSGFTKVIAVGRFWDDFSGIAVDSSHVYVVATNETCREGLSSCGGAGSRPEDFVYDRRLIRVER